MLGGCPVNGLTAVARIETTLEKRAGFGEILAVPWVINVAYGQVTCIEIGSAQAENHALDQAIGPVRRYRGTDVRDALAADLQEQLRGGAHG